MLRLALLKRLALAVLFGLSVRADAADHPVNSESDLRAAIATAVDGDTITFNVDVTLTQDLPAIQTNVKTFGSNRILDGAGSYRGFFVARFASGLNAPVAVTIQDLTIRNARAGGGAGQDNAGGGGAVSLGFPGGGGGAGLGGALFVQEGGNLSLSGPLTINGNTVTGGAVRDPAATR